MDERHQRLTFRPDVPWSVQLAEHKTRSIDALARAREVLNEAVGSDTFLGRQHYEIIPLPHQELDDLDRQNTIAVRHQDSTARSREADANATRANARAIDDRTGACGQSCA